MTALLQAVITCDGWRNCGTTSPPATRAWQARSDARGDGWHRTTTGRDVCPTCWEKGDRR